MTGLPFEVVDNDGSPHGGKDFVFWNPPLIDDGKTARRSANSEATNIFAELLEQNIRTLTFANTRRLTELIYTYTRDKLGAIKPALAKRIKPYRAGYLAEDRRQIERDLFSGRLLGVVATNALELGIDIGDLDATVLTGYPGSIASTWQQAGRSGRGKQQSLCFLIGRGRAAGPVFHAPPGFLFPEEFRECAGQPGKPVYPAGAPVVRRLGNAADRNR